MGRITISEFVPESIILAYKNMSGSHYLEGASVKVQNGKIKPGAFSPVSKKMMKEIAEAVTGEYFNFQYNVLEQERQVLKFEVKGSGIEVAWVVEPAVKTLYFKGVDGLKTGSYPLPKLIFHVKNEELYIYGVTDEVITKKSILYVAPFANTTNGNVCMGNANVRESEKSLNKLISSWEQGFFKSYFTHTTEDKIVNGNFVTVFNSLKGTAEFPNTLLVPTKKTLSVIFKDQLPSTIFR